MFNIFKKKPKEVEIFSPIDGKLIKLEDVDDPVFSGKMMGDGFAVEADDSIVKSPADGVISILHESHHAFGITTDDGCEILVHVGMDTVGLKGLGFKPLKSKGDKVKAGDPILEVDFDLIKDKIPSTHTPVVVTNIDDYDILKLDLTVSGNDSVMKVIKK